MTSKHFGRIAAGAALIALAGCAAADGTDAQEAATQTSSSASKPAEAGPAAEQGLELRLAAGGLAVGEPGLHPRDNYEFGMSRAEIVDIVSGLRGPSTDQSANDECGADAMEFTSFGPLTLNCINDEWVGWSMSQTAGDPPLASEFGTGIGVSRSEMDVDDLTVEESTLGTEFDARGIYGLFADQGADAKVTELWAGAACNFR